LFELSAKFFVDGLDTLVVIIELIVFGDKLLIVICIEVLFHLLHLSDFGLVAADLLPQFLHHFVLVVKFDLELKDLI
jgi:hypothetical protein